MVLDINYLHVDNIDNLQILTKLTFIRDTLYI